MGRRIKFKLKYEKWSPSVGTIGTKGTIRTTPENYYVASVLNSGRLEFKGIEAMTRNMNRKAVSQWWYNYKKKHSWR